MFAFWRLLEAEEVLQCPVCRSPLRVTENSFRCLSCDAIFPVESGVPLLMKPDEIISIPDLVMDVFNVPSFLKGRVETALEPLTKYRTISHPEFANFFARFDASEIQVRSIPLSSEQNAAAVKKLECLTHYFPSTLRSDQTEFRSIRLKNNSDHVLFTDELSPLYLSYKVFDENGERVPFDAELSQLPVPLRPGAELTVPIMVKLPKGLTGQFTVCFYFLLARRRENDKATPIVAPVRLVRTWISALRRGLKRQYDAQPSTPEGNPLEQVQWFDEAPLAIMLVKAINQKANFPAIYHDTLQNFTVEKDVSRADDFLIDVVKQMQLAGVKKPRILEVGAGVYPISLRTCGDNSTVVVSDISLVMQTLASIMHTNNPAVLDRRAAFASFDMMHPPFKDGTFDIICISAALHHISCPHKFLQRLAPLLSEKGRFVAVREPCLVNPLEPAYISELANGFNEQMFELPEWQEIVSSGGFVFDSAIIEFECSLKFSARLLSSERGL